MFPCQHSLFLLGFSLFYSVACLWWWVLCTTYWGLCFCTPVGNGICTFCVAFPHRIMREGAMGTDSGLGVVISKQHIIVYLLSFVLSCTW
jgi:hypothetical protein